MPVEPGAERWPSQCSPESCPVPLPTPALLLSAWSTAPAASALLPSLPGGLPVWRACAFCSFALEGEMLNPVHLFLLILSFCP